MNHVAAICMDYTQSQATGSGACSHHGGVRQWITHGGAGPHWGLLAVIALAVVLVALAITGGYLWGRKAASRAPVVRLASRRSDAA